MRGNQTQEWEERNEKADTHDAGLSSVQRAWPEIKHELNIEARLRLFN